MMMTWPALNWISDGFSSTRNISPRNNDRYFLLFKFQTINHQYIL